MNWFDGLVIDGLWVRRSKIWRIAGMEGIPYAKPWKTILVRRSLGTVVYLVLALAIARQESGCHPWIINISGRDVRPRSKEEAIQYAQWAMRSGRSFDVGIMQINAYWIKRYGWPVEQVLEPANNIKIGVWILAQEIRRHGLNWKAVAYYHTPLHKNPERGRAYARSVVGHVKKILDGK